MKPKLAVFPKCFMDELCVHHTMTVLEWIDLAATLEVDGLEFFSGFFGDDKELPFAAKSRLAEHRLEMPMLCCSPDFTQVDSTLVKAEIEREIAMIELTAFFEGKFCRVLSGQRRPEITLAAGIAQVVQIIKELLPVAEQHRVILTMENHYKDNFWHHPEFAQKMAVFGQIVDQIDSPWFGVNYDPSNTILAGEDPLEL
ncbi:MAG: sugar phosphate isomerase/epimerase, partial [Verrucomicrobia bacterium]|nr:sugar phosphate isomerase/epimerase [Verrucomicrobiota bacterium]